jgi:hypothetical protein
MSAENRLTVFENSCGKHLNTRKEVTGGGRKIYKKEFHNLLKKNIRVIKIEKDVRIRTLPSIENMRNACTSLFTKT